MSLKKKAQNPMSNSSLLKSPVSGNNSWRLGHQWSLGLRIILHMNMSGKFKIEVLSRILSKLNLITYLIKFQKFRSARGLTPTLTFLPLKKKILSNLLKTKILRKFLGEKANNTVRPNNKCYSTWQRACKLYSPQMYKLSRSISKFQDKLAEKNQIR